MPTQATSGSPIRRFVSATSTYAFGTLIHRGYTVLLLPVYLAVLTPRDFGILALTEAISVPLASVLGLCLDRSVTRFYYAWDEAERPLYLGAIWMASLLSAATATLLLIWLGPSVFPVLIGSVPFEPYLLLACLIAALKSQSLLPLMILRVREQARWYVALSTGSSLIGSGFILWFIDVERMGALGVLIGTLANELLWSVVWAGFMWRHTRLRWSRARLRGVLRYSLPFVPSDLAYSFGHSVDRLVLDKLIPLSELGLYSVGARIARVFLEANQAAKNSWIPLALRLATDRSAAAAPDAPTEIAALARAYFAASAVLGLCLALFAPEFILLFGGPAFEAAGSWTPGFVLAYFGFVYYFIALPGINISRRSEYVTFVTFLFAGLSFAGTVLLAPALGAAGALIAYGCAIYAMAFAAVSISRRLYPLSFPDREALFLWGLAAAIGLVGQLLGGGWQATGAKLVLLGAFAYAVWIRTRPVIRRVYAK